MLLAFVSAYFFYKLADKSANNKWLFALAGFGIYLSAYFFLQIVQFFINYFSQDPSSGYLPNIQFAVFFTAWAYYFISRKIEKHYLDKINDQFKSRKDQNNRK